MTILASTSDIIRVVTGSAVSNIECQVSWVDLSGSTYTPGSTETEITTATTTTICAAPASSTYRRIKTITIRNNSTGSSQVTVQKFNGTLSADLMGVTLRAGETLHKDTDGDWRHLSATGAEYAYSAPLRGILGISGSKAESMPRMLCVEASMALTSGTLLLQPIWLVAGTVVNSITFFSSTTAAGTPTNQIFGLYNLNRALLGQTSNDTTTAWAANTIKTLNLTSAYTVPTTGMYFLGVMVTATTAPSLKGFGPTNGSLNVMPHVLGGTSSAGLTTALPNPAALPSTVSAHVWGCVS